MKTFELRVLLGWFSPAMLPLGVVSLQPVLTLGGKQLMEDFHLPLRNLNGILVIKRVTKTDKLESFNTHT